MRIINVHEAKTHLSELIARASQGQEIVIGRAGKPVAKLTAFDLDAKPREPGGWKGKVRLSRDFDRLPARSFGKRPISFS